MLYVCIDRDSLQNRPLILDFLGLFFVVVVTLVAVSQTRQVTKIDWRQLSSAALARILVIIISRNRGPGNNGIPTQLLRCSLPLSNGD